MINALQSELTINVVASIIVSLLFLGLGFLWGKYKERQRKFGRNLEEYDFYPFTVTRENFGEFSLKDFRLGMHYFLKNEDHTAARQLIFIGEQNNVRDAARADGAEGLRAAIREIRRQKESPTTHTNSSRTTSALCG